MKRTPFVTVLAVLAVGLAAAVSIVAWPRETPRVRAQLPGVAAPAAGFARADRVLPLSFPADHGPHPDFQTEWWYYTGNLQSDGGRHFGYQLTFFRRALVPPASRIARPSAWAADQIYMAHFALADVTGQTYRPFEKLARGAAGLAGAQSEPYRVWLENWSVEETEPEGVRLRAAQDGLELDLNLTDAMGPVLQGDRGYSRKGPDAGNASYYYSLPRLATLGRVRVGDEVHNVEGLSWMDHEFSTSALAENQVGWDWFSLQMDDGSALMVFQIRRADGTIDPFSSGTFVAPDGRATTLQRDDFTLVPQGAWRSPRSGAIYPSRWTVAVPSLSLSLAVEPYLADQEFEGSYAYWEGAVRAVGEQASLPIAGRGYLEMTGYASSMQEQF